MELVVFLIAGTLAIIGALGLVIAKNPVHSALMLVMALFSIAVLFLNQDAQFLAAVQVIVYAGAIVVLFLFVIMLLGVAVLVLSVWFVWVQVDGATGQVALTEPKVDSITNTDISATEHVGPRGQPQHQPARPYLVHRLRLRV